jgi:hypothetical protein
VEHELHKGCVCHEKTLQFHGDITPLLYRVEADPFEVLKQAGNLRKK